MNRRTILWVAPLLAYLLFIFWYTNTGGPLTAEEIEGYIEKLQSSGSTPERIARIRKFMESDTGNQFLMLNNIDMNETPGDVDGAQPGESAAQLMGRYMEHMYPELFKRASHPVYFGVAVHSAMDIVGIEGAENWDQAALMRYRSRRDLFEIATNPAFQGKHHFKIAALTKTIAYPLERMLNF
ncbi:MAG: hypothetical protein ABGY96_12285, partial [bacterium]